MHKPSPCKQAQKLRIQRGLEIHFFKRRFISEHLHVLIGVYYDFYLFLFERWLRAALNNEVLLNANLVLIWIFHLFCGRDAIISSSKIVREIFCYYYWPFMTVFVSRNSGFWYWSKGSLPVCSRNLFTFTVEHRKSGLSKSSSSDR